MSAQARHLPAAWTAFAAASCAASAAFAFRRGQDVNFDQLNYHYYTAYALLHGRIGTDAAPAQIIHSYLNPLGYVPFYLLLRLAGPVAAALALGAAQGLVFVLAAGIATVTAGDGAAWPRRAAIAASVAISAASPMALSEAGTSFIDTLTSLPILAALLLMLRPAAPGIRTVALCGVLAGCATGLKLTNATFALGLLAACLAAGPGRVARTATMAAGMAGGFLLTNGAWCWMLWQRFGNPLFPYYNAIFRSPDFPPTSDIDRRYLPSGLLDGLAYPFRWAAGIVPPPEIVFRDIRFAAVILLLAAGGAVALRRPRATCRDTRLLVFAAVSFALWLAVFAIQRYLVTLEVLCGPLALVGISWLARGWWRAGLAWAVAALALATVFVPNWDHVAFMPGQYGIAVPPDLRGEALYFVAGDPVSYVIPSLPPQARYFGIMEWEYTMRSADTAITRRIAGAVAGAGPEPIRVLANRPLSLQTRLRLGSYGVQPTGACTRLPGFAYRSPANIVCALARGATGIAALAVAPGQALDLRDDSTAFLARSSDVDWLAPVAADGAAALILRPAAFGPGDIGVRLRYGGPPAGLAVTFGGVRAATAETRDGAATIAAACVPGHALGEDGTLSIGLQARDPGQRVTLLQIRLDAGCPA